MMQIRSRHLQIVRCMVCNIILFEGRRVCPIRFFQISSLCGRFLKTCVFSVKKRCLRVDEKLKGRKNVLSENIRMLVDGALVM